MRKTVVVAALALACFAPTAHAQLAFDDARVDETNPTANAGPHNLKARGSTSAPPCGSPSACMHSYLKFNIPLAPNQKVASARLILTPVGSSSAGVQTRGVAGNNWTEGGLTWANRPALLGSGGASGPTTCTTQGCVSVDVSSIVPWNGGWTTIALTSNNYFEALSREDDAGSRPRLDYTAAPYADTQPPTAPSGLTQISATATTVKIGWASSTDDVHVNQYRVHKNGSQVGYNHFYYAYEIPDGDGMPYEDQYRQYTYTGLTCGTSYTATVTAGDPTGNFSPASPPLTITTNECGVHLNEQFTGTPGSMWVSQQAFTDDPPSAGDTAGAAQNPNWFAENGEVVVDGGTDANTARASGIPQYGNFRIYTRRKDFLNVKVTHRLRIDSYGPTALNYHGVKLWLRRQLCTPLPNCERVNDHPNRAGYTVEYGLKGDRVWIQKRANGTCTAGSDGDPEYDHIGSEGTVNFENAGWKTVGGTVKNNPNGSVTIQALIDGQVVAEATDTGACNTAPWVAAGRVGLRSDRTEMHIDDLVVRDFP